MMTKEQIEELERLAEPLVQWVRANCDPHTAVVIEDTSVKVIQEQVGLTFFTDPL